jgi:hypothetical protein
VLTHTLSIRLSALVYVPLHICTHVQLHTLFTTVRTHILGIKDGVEVSITHKRKADEVVTAPALAFELLEPSDLPLESIRDRDFGLMKAKLFAAQKLEVI